jgi:hypothetical protein
MELEDTIILTKTKTAISICSISKGENEGIKYVAGFLAHFWLKIILWPIL